MSSEARPRQLITDIVPRVRYCKSKVVTTPRWVRVLPMRTSYRDIFLLACCREPQKTAQVQFTGLPADVAEGDVLFESPRTITAKNGTFSDWFAPFDVHVYRFKH